MNQLIKKAWWLSRSSAVHLGLGLVLLAIVGLGSSMSHADPADFQAMPGLWKITVHKLDHGKSSPPSILWHCIDEGADPWVAFANFSIPEDSQCQRNDKHRSSTALAWTLTCASHPPVHGRGRVDFDSAEHYTASIVLQDRGEVIRVEGKRYAACTSAND
jgi:hypothetical protein